MNLVLYNSSIKSYVYQSGYIHNFSIWPCVPVWVHTKNLLQDNVYNFLCTCDRQRIKFKYLFVRSNRFCSLWQLMAIKCFSFPNLNILGVVLYQSCLLLPYITYIQNQWTNQENALKVIDDKIWGADTVVHRQFFLFSPHLY